MLERARTAWQVASVGAQARLWMFVGLAGAIFGVLTVSFDGPFALAAASFVFGVVGFVASTRDLFATRKRTSALYVVQRDLVTELRATDTYRTWQDEHWGDHRFLYSPELNRQLQIIDIPVMLDGRFSLSAQAREFGYILLRAAQKNGSILHNDKKLRLAEDLTVERLAEARPITLQRTRYFAGVCTNETTTKDVMRRGGTVPLYRGIEACSRNGVLLDLRQSHCSNHIGISTWAFTRDGVLIANIQALRSAQAPNRMVPSGSGSMDRSDLKPGDSLRSLVVRSVERELAEELGLDADRFGFETVLIGYARDVRRGGKPEFFGLTFMSAELSDLKISGRERAYIADLRGEQAVMSDLASSLERFRNAHAATFSPSAHVGLKLLEEAVRDGDGAVATALARRVANSRLSQS